MSERSPQRDALRLLYILVEGSTPLPEPDESGAVALFRGESRLFAFDFWVRNPDYLADELLDLFEEDGDVSHLETAKSIFAAEEPEVRRYPMLRYRFGAYERLDNALSILRSRNLILIPVKRAGEKIRETDFLVMPEAITLAEHIVEEFPDLAWYRTRTKIVSNLAGGRGGAALKKQQHEQIEYHAATLGSTIPSIAGRVRERLNRLNQRDNHD
jgi:hypothetical protein